MYSLFLAPFVTSLYFTPEEPIVVQSVAPEIVYYPMATEEPIVVQSVAPEIVYYATTTEEPIVVQSVAPLYSTEEPIVVQSVAPEIVYYATTTEEPIVVQEFTTGSLYKTECVDITLQNEIPFTMTQEQFITFTNYDQYYSVVYSTVTSTITQETFSVETFITSTCTSAEFVAQAQSSCSSEYVSIYTTDLFVANSVSTECPDIATTIEIFGDLEGLPVATNEVQDIVTTTDNFQVQDIAYTTDNFQVQDITTSSYIVYTTDNFQVQDITTTVELGVTTTEVPIVTELGVTTTEVPIVTELGVTTTEVPIVTELGVTTTEVPVVTELGVTTTEVPIVTELGVATTEVPIVTELGVATTEVPIVTTTEVPVVTETEIVGDFEGLPTPIANETLPEITVEEIPDTEVTEIRDDGLQFCEAVGLGDFVANGTQQQFQTCSLTVQGAIPAIDNMVSTIIISPENNAVISLGTNFTITIRSINIEYGFFDDPASLYYLSPQRLNSQGIIQGHNHVAIQKLLGQGEVPSAQNPLFFKGLNEQSLDGTLSTDVNGELFTETGEYRLCTSSASQGHQPVLSPVARRFFQDDCIRFTIVN